MAPIFRQGFNMNDRMITWRQVVLCFQRLFQICSCVNMHYSHSSVLSKNIFLYEIPFTQVHLSLSLSLILSGVPQKDKSTVPSHYMYIVCCIIFVRSNKHLECISFVIKHVFSILNPKFFLHLRSWMFTSLQSSSSLPFDGALLQILAHYLHLLISWIVWNHWQECNGKPITHMHMHVRLCSHTNRDPLIKKNIFHMILYLNEMMSCDAYAFGLTYLFSRNAQRRVNNFFVLYNWWHECKNGTK